MRLIPLGPIEGDTVGPDDTADVLTVGAVLVAVAVVAGVGYLLVRRRR